MKVIMLEDVKKVGKKDAIVDVSDGYANNYLIKNKMAVPYTKRSKEILDKKIETENTLEENKVQEYLKVKKELENKVIKFEVKAGMHDKVFGKISTKQIAEELKKLGYNIDKKCIKLQNDLDTLGSSEIEIVLHKKVSFKIRVNLVK